MLCVLEQGARLAVERGSRRCERHSSGGTVHQQGAEIAFELAFIGDLTWQLEASTSWLNGRS